MVSCQKTIPWSLRHRAATMGVGYEITDRTIVVCINMWVLFSACLKNLHMKLSARNQTLITSDVICFKSLPRFRNLEINIWRRGCQKCVLLYVFGWEGCFRGSISSFHMHLSTHVTTFGILFSVLKFQHWNGMTFMALIWNWQMKVWSWINDLTLLGHFKVWHQQASYALIYLSYF